MERHTGSEAAIEPTPAACCSSTRAAVANPRESCGNASLENLLVAKQVVIPVLFEHWPIVPAGNYWLGTDGHEGFPADAEGPAREVAVASFRISPYAVTNKEYAAFVDATGYVTESERFGWSYVFHLLLPSLEQVNVIGTPPQTPWWLAVEGAYWKQPEGPGSEIVSRMDHPVVHISWNDATAYCRWAGVRLPTEIEWETAARGGLRGKRYPWGDVLRQGGEHQCNIWQGVFPTFNQASDGYAGTSPVHTYKPNGYGLYNMSGNVWEWCSDWFTSNPKDRGSSESPHGPAHGTSRLMKGGSYLCHQSYCNRYRVAARSSNTPDSSSGNIGFRVVVDYFAQEDNHTTYRAVSNR